MSSCPPISYRRAGCLRAGWTLRATCKARSWEGAILVTLKKYIFFKKKMSSGHSMDTLAHSPFLWIWYIPFQERLIVIIAEHYEMLITAVDVVVWYRARKRTQLPHFVWHFVAFTVPVLVFRVCQIYSFVCRPVLRPAPPCSVLCCGCNTWMYAAQHD